MAWTNPGNVLAQDGLYATCSVSNQTSEWLKATGYGFVIPSSGATIIGIQVTIWDVSAYSYGSGVARLVKAGTVQGGAPASSSASDVGGYQVWTYGGPTDLWGGTWAYSDINNSGFGCATYFTVGGNASHSIDYMQVTVYYTLASGFTVVQDAVVYGSETLEIRYDAHYRQGPSSGPYGAVSQVTGDLARMPPSGMESRPCQIFIKPTRGDLNTLADAGLDKFTVKPIHRPSWIFRP